MSTEVLAHILNRAFIHFYASAGVQLSIMVSLEMARRKWAWFPRMHGWMFFIFPALLNLVGIGMFEVTNMAHGQIHLKAWTDFASWIVGIAVSNWGFYRLTPALWRVRWEIEELRNGR